MKSGLRVLAATAMTGALLATGGTALAQQPSEVTAQTGDYCGQPCDVKDPKSFVYNGRKCAADQVGIRSNSFKDSSGKPWGTIVLRYSEFCETTWAEGAARNPVGGGLIELRNESYYANGSSRAVTTAKTWTPGAGTYTAMLDDHNLKNRACMRYTAPASDPGPWLCTEKY
jgi:hypothetical protein